MNEPPAMSVAVRAATYEECAPMLTAARHLLATAGPRVEYLLLLENPCAEPSDSDVRVMHLARNTSYSAFFETARREARGAWLVTIEHPTARDASLLFAFWQRRAEGDVLVASRHAPGAAGEMGALRRMVSAWGNAVAACALAFPLKDMTSGRRMYRMRVLRPIELRSTGREALIELLVRAYGEGARIVELPWHVDAPPPPPMGPAPFARVIRRMHHERNSGNFPDYDSRAYDSMIWLQRYWQRKRFQIVNRFADRPGLWLDVGCGGSRIIKTRPAMVALDLNFKRLRHLAQTNPRRLQATAGSIPFANDVFDVVICSQVIEHTLEGTCVSECVRVLKPGGVFVIGTPDYGTFWWPFWEALYDRVKPHGYVIEHIAHYTYTSLTEEVTNSGCDVVDHAYIGGGELIVKAVKRR